MENGELRVENGSAWREVRLGDVIELIIDHRGKTPKKLGGDWSLNGYRAISAKTVKNGVLVNEDKMNILPKNLYQQWMKEEVKYGDIFLTSEAPLGEHLIWKSYEKVILSQRIFGIRTNKTIINPFYFNYFIDSPYYQHELTCRESGSTVTGIKQSELLKTRILFPPLPEQKAIAEVLSALDDKIDLLHRQNKTLEQMAETLFRQWFVVESGEDWVEKPLSSVANFLNGLACQKFPPKNEVDKFPVLKIKQLRNGFSDECDWCTTEVKAEYIIENGDVIFSWSASLMVKIWDGDQCILNQHLFKVTSDDFPKWYYYLWSKHHLAEFVSISSSHATTMGHIKRGDLDDAMVLVPSPEESEEFSEIFTPLLDKIISNNKRLKNLTSLRDTLLPKLMSGEVRIASNG